MAEEIGFSGWKFSDDNFRLKNLQKWMQGVLAKDKKD